MKTPKFSNLHFVRPSHGAISAPVPSSEDIEEMGSFDFDPSALDALGMPVPAEILDIVPPVAPVVACTALVPASLYVRVEDKETGELSNPIIAPLGVQPGRAASTDGVSVLLQAGGVIPAAVAKSLLNLGFSNIGVNTFELLTFSDERAAAKKEAALALLPSAWVVTVPRVAVVDKVKARGRAVTISAPGSYMFYYTSDGFTHAVNVSA